MSERQNINNPNESDREKMHLKEIEKERERDRQTDKQTDRTNRTDGPDRKRVRHREKRMRQREKRVRQIERE